MNPLHVAREAVEVHGALQKPNELAGLLALLVDEAPQVVLEIGSDAGGTLWAWQQLPSVRRVIALDMPQAGYHSGRPLAAHDVEVVHGDSHSEGSFTDVLDRLCGGGDQWVDFLMIDGDHTYRGVKLDFDMYEALVRTGGLVGFHDICPHPGMPEVEVARFWAELGGDKETIVTDPATWGGIGLLRVGTPADRGYAASPQLGSVTELLAR